MPQRPKKPQRNPGHIAFPKAGPVRKVIEEFPRQQDDLELTVGRKFVGAMQHFKGTNLVELSRGSEPADLVCKTDDGATVNLQVVEAVNQGLRELRSMREAYREGHH